MKARILLLPGDGVGPEVIEQARRALMAVGGLFGHKFSLLEGLIGSAAMTATGSALPADTMAACRVCDAVLVGAVDDDVADCLRELSQGCEVQTCKMPVKASHLTGVDTLIIRNRWLVGSWGGREDVGTDEPVDPVQSIGVIRAAFREALRRRCRLAVVDTQESLSRLVDQVSEGYPDVVLEYLELMEGARRLVEHPASFDVILGCDRGQDVLHRQATIVAGSSGTLPTATLGEGTFGIYEPAHGSVSPMAGLNQANPTAALLSAALLLRHSLELFKEARSLEIAVAVALNKGSVTADLADDPTRVLGTRQFGDAVLAQLPRMAAMAQGRA